MNAQPEDIVQVIRLEADESSAKQSESAIQAVRAQIQGLSDEVAQLTPATEAAALPFEELHAAASQLGQDDVPIQNLTQQVSALHDEVEQTTIGFDDLSRAKQKAADTSGGGGAGDDVDSGDGLDIAPSEARGLRYAISSLPGGQQISSIIQSFSLLGPLGAVASVAAVGIKAATDAEEARTKAAQDAADAINNIALGAAGGTTDSINKQIQQQQANLDAQTEAQKSLQGYSQQLNDVSTQYDDGKLTLAQYAQQQEDLAANIKIATGGQVDFTDKINAAAEALKNTSLDSASLPQVFGELSKASGDLQTKLGSATDDLGTKIDATKSGLAGLAVELTTDSVAANNAAAAQQVLTKSQEDAVNQAIQIDGMTKDQRDAKAAQDVRDINLINQQIQAGGLTEQATDDLIAKQAQLQAEYEALIGVTNSAADATARETKVKQDALDTTNNYLDAVTAENAAIQAVDKAQQALTESAQAHSVALGQIQTQEQTKEAQDRAQAAQQAEEDQEKHLERLAQINQDAASEEKNAVRDRNVDADIQAREKAATATQQEGTTFDQQEKQQAAHLTTQLQSDAQAAKDQEAAEDAHYTTLHDQQVEALNEAEVEQSRADGLAAGYQRQYNDDQLNSLIGLYNSLTSTTQLQNNYREIAEQTHQQRMLNIADTYLPLLENRFAAALSNLVNIVSGGNPLASLVLQTQGELYSQNNPITAPQNFTNAVQNVVDQRLLQVWSGR